MEDYKKKYENLLQDIDIAIAGQKEGETKIVLQSIKERNTESKDEKIRKMIINLVKEHSVNHERCQMEEWLGKQGKQTSDKIVEKAKTEKQRVLLTESDGKANIDWDTRSIEDAATLLKFGLDYINRQKQGKQKPNDRVEPKFKVKYAGSEYNVLEVKGIAGVTFYGIEDEPNHIDYVKAESCKIIGGYVIKENGSPYPTKPAVFSEQKSAWSEEDERYFRNSRCYLNEYGNWLSSKNEEKSLSVYKACDWLKSLKPQPKQEWSEEDENMEKLITRTLKSMGTLNLERYHNMDFGKVTDWLKSLKERMKGE